MCKENFTENEQKVLRVMKGFASRSQDGTFSCGVRAISKQTELSVGTASKITKKLLDEGLIELVEKGDRTTNTCSTYKTTDLFRACTGPVQKKERSKERNNNITNNVQLVIEHNINNLDLNKVQLEIEHNFNIEYNVKTAEELALLCKALHSKTSKAVIEEDWIEVIKKGSDWVKTVRLLKELKREHRIPAELTNNDYFWVMYAPCPGYHTTFDFVLDKLRMLHILNNDLTIDDSMLDALFLSFKLCQKFTSQIYRTERLIDEKQVAEVLDTEYAKLNAANSKCKDYFENVNDVITDVLKEHNAHFLANSQETSMP